MEDEHTSFDDIEQDYPQLIDTFGLPLAFYGIYDGHRGIRAAEFAAEFLHTNILEHSDFSTNTELAIREGFIQTDDEFITKAKSQEEQWNDGCTAVVAIFLGTKLYIANCGDAEILLGRKNEDSDTFETIELTHKHKPSDPAEKDRIRAAGGMVLAGRVGGALAVSRAFGDLEFKTPFQDGDLTIGKLITADPYVTSIDLIHSKDLFLIIGCDGVWERMSHQDSVNFVGKNLKEEEAEVLSEMVVNRAFSRGSQDNISCTIVRLNWDETGNSDDNEENEDENEEENEEEEEEEEDEEEEKDNEDNTKNENKEDDENEAKNTEDNENKDNEGIEEINDSTDTEMEERNDSETKEDVNTESEEITNATAEDSNTNNNDVET